MMRRAIAGLLLFGLGSLFAGAGNQDWQQPPARVPANAPQLSRLLVDEHGRRIASKRGWRQQRALLQAQWQAVLGEFPAAKPPLRSQVLGTEELPEFTRQYVTYQVEEGVFTDGYLLTPRAAKGRLPAVVVFHPTTPLQAKGVAGLAAEYDREKWQGVQLVQRGYIVWCPRNYIETAGTNWAGNAARVRARHPRWTGMTRMVWDAIRAADFVTSLPRVDRKRLGCLGHSLGGKEVLFAMAFEPRYRAGVSSEGGIGLKFSNWEAPWYFGRQIQQPGFQRENHEVLALAAPRAFLLLAGDSADDDRSWEFIQAARPVYELLGAARNLGWLNHHQGHRYAPEARAAAEAFLDQHLKPRPREHFDRAPPGGKGGGRSSGR
ncbi:MAG: acetylxylan esterase [Verrucomicrobia bacterium]|jgi:dienelactone hydrolase|nr:acetylxylan esterase [Verrucomicrobiota bacterium]HRY57735.1 prolyl oligopeptidase family serine peptidase [Candidatus Paceibacterota bacterium]HNR71592.1 prolyl oligopeptidase family serine peptidase [Verrucomicrobiota bacterium]HNS70861.1 prolyl oligopeptidase family serine peptidase [Verrucomicrobiota bacterium]HNZ76341.1 prolyl oligopeptidase family serine peptidase [Verrucomicrobiota bacterium]